MITIWTLEIFIWIVLAAFFFGIPGINAQQIFVENRDGSSALTPIDAGTGYSFAVITDPRVGKYGKEIGDGDDDFALDIQLLKIGIENLNLVPNLAFMACIGDTAQSQPNGTDNAKPEEYASQTQAAMDAFALAKVPLFVLSGDRAMGDLWETMQVIPDYTALFGDDYYQFKLGAVQYLALNDWIWNLEDLKALDYSNEHFSWFEDQVAAYNADDSMERLIILMHIPPFYDNPEELTNGEQLLRMNGQTGEVVRRRFLEDLPTSKPVTIISGHMFVNRSPNDYPGVQISRGVTLMKANDPDAGGDYIAGRGGVRIITVSDDASQPVKSQFVDMGYIANYATSQSNKL